MLTREEASWEPEWRVADKNGLEANSERKMGTKLDVTFLGSVVGGILSS